VTADGGTSFCGWCAELAHGERAFDQQKARAEQAEQRAAELEQELGKAVTAANRGWARVAELEAALRQIRDIAKQYRKDVTKLGSSLARARTEAGDWERLALDGARVAEQYMDTGRGDLDGWIDRARALAGDGGGA
jgi:chromosome segregation ATPase